VREVAQAGAVIGRDFTYDLVAAVTSLPQARLDEALARLEAAGLVQRRGVPPEAAYTFKHALLQDAAYGTLLRERRRELHAAVARIVEGRSPQVADGSPHILAHHLEEAGDILRATSFRLKAAERAISRSALAEALSEIGKARARIAALADTAERWRVELDLELAAGKTLAALKGYSAPETGAAYECALFSAVSASPSSATSRS
jgi:predicted ATPase